MIQNLFFRKDHGCFVHGPHHLEILLVIETVAEDIAKALQGPLEGVSHSLLPRLLNAQRLLSMLILNQNVAKNPFCIPLISSLH